MLTKQCSHCNITFETIITNKKYCSELCRNKVYYIVHKNKKFNNHTRCLQCSNLTINPKFCNQSCAAKFNNKFKTKRKLKNTCVLCQTGIHKKSKFCKTCKTNDEMFKTNAASRRVEIPSDLTLKEAMYKNSQRSSSHALIRTRARALCHKLYSACKFCGYNKHIEIAHIKPISSFPDDTPLSIINSLSNLLPLCPNCHWEFDRGRKDIYGNEIIPQEVQKIKKQRKINTKIKWPSIETILNCLQYCSKVELGKLLGVSDNAINKHLGVHRQQVIKKITNNLELVKELLNTANQK